MDPHLLRAVYAPQVIVFSELNVSVTFLNVGCLYVGNVREFHIISWVFSYLNERSYSC